MIEEALMFVAKSIDWWRDQILLAVSDFLRDPNDITSAKIKTLLKSYQLQHESKDTVSIGDEHERVMDFR
jgi:hypothetical protein